MTIEAPAEALYKDKGSRFLAFAYPVANEEQIRERLDALRKKYFDATHHCYAWRLGPSGDSFRAMDDGEPSSTAGRPILGQMLSRNVTNALIVVVRYFGGTKLGVPGLIAAYREIGRRRAGRLSRSSSGRSMQCWKSGFGYLVLNDVMRIVKEMQPQVLAQRFDNACTMTLAIRSSAEELLRERLAGVKACGSIERLC
ncbi:MAG: IMPACT family protein [Alistipes indistinctus]